MSRFDTGRPGSPLEAAAANLPAICRVTWLELKARGQQSDVTARCGHNARRVTAVPENKRTFSLPSCDAGTAGHRKAYLTSFSIDDHTDHCYFFDPFVAIRVHQARKSNALMSACCAAMRAQPCTRPILKMRNEGDYLWISKSSAMSS
jgi:hypothetical protein